MRRFYGIVGPESSGTRLVASLFVNAGCFGDAPQDKQRLDNVVTGNEFLEVAGCKPDQDVVLRRSVPYGAEWPDLKKINEFFVANRYQPLWIILLRDWTCNVKSKMRLGHKTDINQANTWLFEEIKFIFNSILAMNVPFFVLNTSLLFERREKALTRLSEVTGLNFDCKIINNADLKYIYENEMK